MEKVMTNAAADRAYTALSQATEETGVLGYAIARTKQHLETELKPYQEIKQEAIRKLGTDLGDGKIALQTTDQILAFEREVGDTAKEEITVDVHQVDEDVFISGTLTAAQMAELMFMVKGDEKPAKEETQEIAEVKD